MAKNILKVASFCLVFAFLFGTVSYALRPHAGSFLHIQTYGMQPKDTIDVVYFGGSSCFTYWAPMEAWREYGFTSFNFANNTMPAQLEKYCIKEALKKQSPKLLVVDVRPFEYAESYRESGDMNMYNEPAIRNFTDSFRYSLNRFGTIQNGVPRQAQQQNGEPQKNNRLEYHFDISKYHANLSNLLKKNSWKYAFNQPDDHTKNFGGFEFYPRYDAAFERTDYSQDMQELALSDTLAPIYLDLIDYCKSLNVSVLFLIPPYGEPGESHQKHNYMRRVADEQGIPFLDCNDIFDETGLDVETDFYNDNHTNIFGAKKYTKWFGQYLKENYDLPDRRGDSNYADWEVAYQEWKRQVPEAEEGTLAVMPAELQAKIRGRM